MVGSRHYERGCEFRPEVVAQQLAHDGPLALAIAQLPSVEPLPELALAQPRYSASADRSQLGGAVLVRFWVREDGGTQDIRVLEMPHPLLASWAIEAVAGAKVTEVSTAALPRAGVRRFVFQTRRERMEASDASE